MQVLTYSTDSKLSAKTVCNHVSEQTSLTLSSILSVRFSLMGRNQKPQVAQFNINSALIHSERLKISVTSADQFAIPSHRFYGTSLSVL
jgi:hypothetical protein